MVLEATLESADGHPLGKVERIFMPQAGDGRGGSVMQLGADRKLGFLADTSLQPLSVREERIEFTLPQGAAASQVRVRLAYQLRPDDVYPLHDLSIPLTGEPPKKTFSTAK